MAIIQNLFSFFIFDSVFELELSYSNAQLVSSSGDPF